MHRLGPASSCRPAEPTSGSCGLASTLPEAYSLASPPRPGTALLGRRLIPARRRLGRLDALAAR